jgi:large subunit ribosomal protein L10
MRENRTTYPKRKTQMYQQLQELPKKYKVLGLVRMEKVRASQILPLRKKLKNEVEFVSVKDKIAKKALEQIDVPGIKKLVKQIKGQCLFMFTNMSPFKLNVLLAKNKIMLPARGGDIASIDVVISPKNTGIPPGPMLTDFKEAKVPTKIDQGTIWITKETIPVRKGEVVSEKLATLLGKLDIKAVEAGVSLAAALEEGLQYSENDLFVDTQKVRDAIARAYQEAVSLSIEAAYVTPENVKQILGKAAQSARALSVEAGYLTDETKEQILQRAQAKAKALASKAKGYTPA